MRIMATEQLHRAEDAECQCFWCRQDRPFELPESLAKAVLEGDLVIFAGAGISTESRMVVPQPLYVEMLAESKLDPRDGLSFPEVMTAYESAYGRVAMLERIKKHLDMVRSFPKLDGAAGRFHEELAGIFTLNEIVTTNWDDYFERKCGAQPFITEADWAFWKSSERKVFKLHGSISSPGSVVATQSDYDKCYQNLNEGLIGAQLKMMLATKTIAFVGYSLRDSDFVALYQLIKGKMGDLFPRAYFVSPDGGKPPLDFAQDMHVIRTSGVKFAETLKTAFSEEELVPDDRFEAAPYIRAVIGELHHKMVGDGEMREDPAMYLCACYQDGLTDAFDHQIANAPRGPYHHRCYSERLVDEVYLKLFEERAAEGQWETAAYIEGYIRGLEFLTASDEERKKLSPYYVPGIDEPLITWDDYKAAAAKLPHIEPEIFKYAKEEAERLAPGIVFHHLPFLFPRFSDDKK
jgi:hypothetical protein